MAEVDLGKIKVGILTFHKADNFGALLQAYALLLFLKETGYDAEIIDYDCKAVSSVYAYPIFPRFRKNVLAWFLQLYSLAIMRHKGVACDNFRNKYFVFSRLYMNDQERYSVQENYDIIVTGSDQIWSPLITHGKNDWYCFKYSEPTNCKFISYAASIGSIESFSPYMEHYLIDLKKYDAISVREKSTQDYFQSYLGLNCETDVDPTLLLGRDSWIRLSSTSDLNFKRPFIFYYDAEYNAKAYSIARQLSKKTGIKLIYFCNSIYGKNKITNIHINGPEDFLLLIRNAQYIVASSFHATVFSLIFQKRFISVPHEVTSNRVVDLLNEIGLSDRLVKRDNEDFFELIDKEIDYRAVYERLDGIVNKSQTFLMNMSNI